MELTQMLEKNPVTNILRNGTNSQNVDTTERYASMAIGALMLMSGIRSLLRHPVGGLTKTMAGGLLLYRGASGHCPVYESLGKTSPKTEPVDLRTTVTVNRPKEEVYRFWRQLENLPKFMK